MVLDHCFGNGSLSQEQVLWPGSAAATQRWIAGLHREWQQAMSGRTAPDLASTARTRWPFRDRPFGDVIAWANVELTKNAAEIGYARFLYATRLAVQRAVPGDTVASRQRP